MDAVLSVCGPADHRCVAGTLAIVPADARILSLAIQRVGMTAALLMILFMRIPVAWAAVLWVGLAGIPGIVVSSLWLAPMVSPPATNYSVSFSYLG